MAPELAIANDCISVASLGTPLPHDIVLPPLAEEEAVDVDTVVIEDLLFPAMSLELVTWDNCLKKCHKSPWGKCSNTEQ